MKKTSLLFLLSLSATTTFAANETHPEVAEALAYQLPAHDCVPPKQNIRNQAQTQGASSDNSFGGLGGGEELGGSTVDYDTNSVDRARIERARKRYGKCLEGYRADLIKDFGEIKDVVKHGVTMDQANQLLETLSLIQRTVESPNGVAAPKPAESQPE